MNQIPGSSIVEMKGLFYAKSGPEIKLERALTNRCSLHKSEESNKFFCIFSVPNVIISTSQDRIKVIASPGFF